MTVIEHVAPGLVTAVKVEFAPAETGEETDVIWRGKTDTVVVTGGGLGAG